MQKSIKIFFIFSLLILFVSNVSGISVCLEHSKHASSNIETGENSSDKKESTISKDDQCQCAIHLQMNTCLFPEVQHVNLVSTSENNTETPHSKAITYTCLIDFFSSRAPPYQS